ncbi:MAG: cell division protein ZipA C-terminal FtsZ-binding domain-containing protein [Proteobacteria bacterium]|nr:cell division protein ZipA C-terminal FtsZ-binding domain-containing protein [Pseudomonadota bacterium]
MSELQAALLAIGLGVVVAVYVFGWWKQRQYSRKFGAAFRQSHEDALYQAAVTEHAAEPLDDIVMINGDALPDEIVTEVAEAITEPVEIVATLPASGPCSLLDARSDFIIALHPAEASAAAVLDGLWQRKFDFRKPLQVCGLIARTGQWERVIAESQSLYSQFRIALQLVDRSGVISVPKLGDFRDLVLGIAKNIGADTTIPDILETHAAALGLDALCAEVDQMVGVNLLPPGERLLNGGKINEAAALQGMKLESDGAFHLSDNTGNTLISLINKDTKPFQHHSLEQSATTGITLMLDVPRVENPVANFDLMVQMAHALARELQVNLVDDHRVPLTDAGLARIRAQIGEVQAKMLENNLVPGSAQARRLFS